MEKEKLKHIALELVFTWLFLALVFAFAIQQKSIDICIFDLKTRLYLYTNKA